VFRDTYMIIYLRTESNRSKKQKKEVASFKFAETLNGKATSWKLFNHKQCIICQF